MSPQQQRSFRSRVRVLHAFGISALVVVFLTFINGHVLLAVSVGTLASLVSHLYFRDFRCPSCGDRLPWSELMWLYSVAMPTRLQFFGPRPDPCVPCPGCGADVHAA